MASAYICFLLFVVPYIHTEIQQSLTRRIPRNSSSSLMPYAKCFNIPESDGVIEGMKKSYDQSLNVGECIRREAKGYLKIIKNG
jgi:translation initiation factor 2 beta subunit (eIF-2beta)/eIF-5